MKNRVPKYPGRIKLKDVLTGEERLYDMTRADEPTEEGTPINKETLLTDQTAALYPGLTGDSTPNDAYAFLGGYTQWRWNRRTVKWTPAETAKTNVDLTGVFEWTATKTIKWAKEIEFSDAGEVQLKNPTIVSFTHDSLSALDVTKGNYVAGHDGKIYRVDNSAVFSNDQYVIPSGDYYVKASNAYEITPSAMYGPWEEVRASTDDAYLDSGISGGYEYEAQGMPLEKAAALSPGGSSGGGSGESWKVGAGLKLSGNVLSVDTATSVATGGDKPVTAAAVKTALDGLTPSPGGSGPVLVPATIQFTLADGGAAAYPQGSTQLWLLYDGLRFWLTGDATFVFSVAVKLSSFSVTVAPDTGYEWNYPVGSGDVLSVIQRTYGSTYITDQPNRISVSFGSTGAVRTYPLLSTYPYTNAVTICAGILGAGKAVDV
ncbi:hypothetical protein H7U37_07975 [Pseudoflavonifractor phocaeensis]|uniref:hypothetical protein n=1 Tax=Pseudoflavonifractor phocaeensis TaxID=1870988 RepID=UPI00195D9B3B|nr:hypothetical protein [Pseudoflavonifractor phocaeensis]MBM6938458.1 hypothetical protein [Pseudoflavonifractor phocaeensis]